MKPDEMPTSAGEGIPNTSQALPITKIGRYTITRLIGEGGMGAVYEAEQDQPRRTVALKVIKPGMASPELLRRFAQESQALGRLQHPGIAQIYEAGTADTGYGPQPYFAMEFIRGETLRDYAAKQSLGTRQRLDIIARVCDAVQHAHQRGLIHRDLKPGNILVDETGQPKILDFGVARVTDSDAQATMQTDVGQLVGTLAYMSPEQVLADPLELDTRSDVYALGVILYELLAGRLPYDISRKIHEALHAIREEDPSRLSSVDRSYRGDIETIAAKALEKDKTRRYNSAAELAADIRHYLNDEPIVARPPSTIYQLEKFGRRHKALVFGLAAVFAALVVGLVLAVWQARRATNAEKAALLDRDRATAAERTATAARDEAVIAKGVAVAAEGQAKLDRDKAVSEKERADTESATAKAVTEFLNKNLFEQVTGGTQRGASPDLSVSGALDRTAAKVEGSFKDKPLVEAGVREAVAGAYLSLLLYEKAAPQIERALALRRGIQGEEDTDVMKSTLMMVTMHASQREFKESAALLSKVVDVYTRRFGADHVDTLKYSLELATMYMLVENFAKAEDLARRVAEGRRRTLGAGNKDTILAELTLSGIYETNQKLPEALTWTTRAYDSSRKSVGENDSMTLSARATIQRLSLKTTAKNAPVGAAARNEYLETAAKSLESAKAASLTDVINIAIRRADIAFNQNQPAQAEAALLEAVDAARRAGQDEPNSVAMLAAAQAMQKKSTEADANLRKALENPASKGMNPNILAFALRSVAQALRSEGKFAEAEPHLQRLVPLVLVTLGEGNGQTRGDMYQLAENYANQRKYAEAEKAFLQLLDVQRRVVGREAIGPQVTASNIGWLRLQQKRYAEAEQILRETSAILTRTSPAVWERFNVESMLGAGLAAQRKFEEAEPLLISGYEGMGRSPRPNTNTTSRFTSEQAGNAIIQLYADWPRPDKRAEWAEKLKAKN